MAYLNNRHAKRPNGANWQRVDGVVRGYVTILSNRYGVESNGVTEDLFGFEPVEKRGRRPEFRPRDLSETLDLPGVQAPTEDDVTKFLCLATCSEHHVSREALKACELLMKLKRMGGFGDKNVNLNVVDPLKLIMDEIADTNPEGGLSDVLTDATD